MSKVATREAYGKTLAKLIQENKNIVVLDADLSKSTKTNDAKLVCPERHFNLGIAEANMMCVAAGLAANGKTVFASSFAMFASGRAFEQIRNSIAYPNLNVKICATHAGLTVGEDGASHQCNEDIAIMNVIPNMHVFQPCDAEETKQVIEAVAEIDGPCYVRLGRSGVEKVYDDNYKFEVGKASVLKSGKKVAIIATGLEVQESLKAIEKLNLEGIEPTLVNVASIKPIDKECIISLAQNHDVLITVEEHSVNGGLGSIVCDIVCANNPVKVIKIGVQDTFGESGKPAELLAKYGLDFETIYNIVKEHYK